MSQPLNKYVFYCCLNCLFLHSRNISEKQWTALGLITLAGCFNRLVSSLYRSCQKKIAFQVKLNAEIFIQPK